jgi:hypothetical protein
MSLQFHHTQGSHCCPDSWGQNLQSLGTAEQPHTAADAIRYCAICWMGIISGPVMGLGTCSQHSRPLDPSGGPCRALLPVSPCQVAPHSG